MLQRRGRLTYRAAKRQFQLDDDLIEDLKDELIYIDETTWYQHRVLAWLWVMVNTMVALFKVQASRNTAAFEALVERWAGKLVSDGYGVYQQWVHGWQASLAHSIRRARGLAERVEEGVEPTNNRAKRALRFAVLWRKIMQGTYNEKGDRWVERILSLRETCRLRGVPTFPIFVEAVTCSSNGQHPDVSWI
jgi:hypothetical protein